MSLPTQGRTIDIPGTWNVEAVYGIGTLGNGAQLTETTAGRPQVWADGLPLPAQVLVAAQAVGL